MRRSGRGAGLGVGGGEIAGSGADGKLAHSFGFGLDANGAITALGDGLGRMIAENILMANILGHIGGDGVDLIERLGKEGDAAGLIAE